MIIGFGLIQNPTMKSYCQLQFQSDFDLFLIKIDQFKRSKELIEDPKSQFISKSPYIMTFQSISITFDINLISFDINLISFDINLLF